MPTVYNRQKCSMKKIIITFAFIGCFIFSAFANEPEKSAVASNTPNEESCEMTVKVTVLSVSNSVVEFLVEANEVVNEVCNYFDNSWVDVGLSIYCTLGGDIYTCTAYKITKMACSLSGAVKLYMEGDINNATKKILKTGAQVWVMSKAGSQVKLSPSNMCPAN